MAEMSRRQEDSMIQIDFNPWMEVDVRQHQEKLRQEVATRRLVDELHRSRLHKTTITADVLALIGKGLTEYGNKLQARFGNKPDDERSITQQRYPESNSQEGG